LSKQEAPVGRGGEDPAPSGLVGDRRVVEVGVEPQERKLEPVLAAGLAVAGPGVAAQAGQERHHVTLEGRAIGGLRSPGGQPEGRDCQQGRPNSPHRSTLARSEPRIDVRG